VQKHSFYILPQHFFLSSPRCYRGRETLGFGSWSETMVQRLIYRKRHSYATKSNQHRVVKTPGNFSSPLQSYISITLRRFARQGSVECNVLRCCGVWLSNVGGKLVYQSTKKRASGPKCPVTGKRIQGVCNIFFSYLRILFLKKIFKMLFFWKLRDAWFDWISNYIWWKDSKCAWERLVRASACIFVIGILS